MFLLDYQGLSFSNLHTFLLRVGCWIGSFTAGFIEAVCMYTKVSLFMIVWLLEIERYFAGLKRTPIVCPILVENSIDELYIGSDCYEIGILR